VFEFPSATAAKVLILGKTANLKIYPNRTSNAWLSLKFNRVEELDQLGRSVYGHAIPSIATLTPTYTTGGCAGRHGGAGCGAACRGLLPADRCAAEAFCIGWKLDRRRGDLLRGEASQDATQAWAAIRRLAPCPAYTRAAAPALAGECSSPHPPRRSPARMTAASPAHRPSPGVRSSGETDYTYVKLTFEGHQLKLPSCPSPEKLAELGLEPIAAAPAPQMPGLKSPAARGGAGVPAGQQQQQQQQQQVAGGGDGGPPRIKTLGDSQLAATIAELTGGLTDAPPPRPEMLPNRRRALRQANGASWGPHTPQGTPVVQIPQHPWYPRPSMLVAPAQGLAGAGGDPFAQFITRNQGVATGGVSVVPGDQAKWDPPQQNNGAPSLTLTFFFGMNADKTFAYGKGNNIVVPADGLKFNIEAANWWAPGAGAAQQVCRG
jgi:hypothetical protein